MWAYPAGIHWYHYTQRKAAALPSKLQGLVLLMRLAKYRNYPFCIRTATTTRRTCSSWKIRRSTLSSATRPMKSARRWPARNSAGTSAWSSTGPSPSRTRPWRASTSRSKPARASPSSFRISSSSLCSFCALQSSSAQFSASSICASIGAPATPRSRRLSPRREGTDCSFIFCLLFP